MPFIHRAKSQHELVRIGSDYGGWWVPEGVLGPQSICYCGGVGTDITFDMGLIERYGCRVWGIDPTPRSVEWIAQQTLDHRFAMVSLGLAGAPGTARFYAPSDPEHVSHSLKNLQQTQDYFEARVVTVGGLQKELGHNRVDLVKLDVEGAEHDVIQQMLSDDIRPTVLCVEYDQPEPLSHGRATTAALKRHGYGLVKVDGFNLTFLRR